MIDETSSAPADTPSAITTEPAPPAADTARRWFEIAFDSTYLVTIWTLVIAMTRERGRVRESDRRTAGLLRRAFLMLAIGDTAHVGFRVLALTRGDNKATVTWLGKRTSLLGIGEMMSSITMTFFYVLTLDAWRVRFGKAWTRFTKLLLGAGAVRVVALAAPQNEWDQPTPPQKWSVYRNVPLLVLGLGQAFLIKRDARRTGDRTLARVGDAMLASFTFYTPVVLFARRVPALGALMIPKTIAYVAMAIQVYRGFYRPAPADHDKQHRD
ncbi:hypothetical protein KHQ06_26950 [Nocardia tengchongensis]|uniref:Uncharacterized protein n=1 Tax=Nocardia tengchongensis TaxID=2055889 RepID=A0ABX8CLW4_9NOCA|nr:hypothetical protein [Nocardia tengchongensis]QVI19913.1 hypothetical protein KHQ06_26950 [Nocardia tengchongensis]